MINEETLTLCYYDDGLTANERRDVEVALGRNPNLAANYAELCRHFESWSQPDDHSTPEHLTHKWQDSIAVAAMQESAGTRKSTARFSLMNFAWGGAVTMAMAIGIGIGMYFSGSTDINPATVPPLAGIPEVFEVVPASFTRGLQLHLQDSEREISGLSVDASGDRAALLTQIIEQNRVFERSAKLNKSDNLARLLRAFEPILMRLASEDIAPADAEALRSQLSFELNVMLTKMAQDTSNDSHST